MANKTEKPTQKKLQDASKKGQILKSRDLTISVIMLVGTLYLGYVFDVHHIMSILEYILDHNAKPDIWDYFKAMGVGWLKTIIPFLLVCMFTTILVSWFQSKMQLATEAVKFKFDSLNPVNGLKRIFGLKTVKEFVKAILYIIFFLHWRTKYFGVIINHCFLKLLMEISYLYYQIGERCYSFLYCIVSAV
ncbi:EscU/YscU/HrcU family type III secretion system export apparatus switch protein [Escherichia coli]